MIGILLNDSAYEQDIRELLMAFYPGQTFAHEMQENLDFFVEGTVNEDRTEFTLCLGYFGSSCFHLLSMEKLEPEIRAEFQAAAENSVLKVNYENRFETKNKIKRRLYVLLMQQTGKQLPWGTLTGIRPTKIAMTKLAEGETPEQIFRHMKDTYFTSDEKIHLSIEIAQRERKLLSTIDYKEGYSLYVGIPFCPTTCLYCSFTSFPVSRFGDRMRAYLDALYKELAFVAKHHRDKKLTTIYIGGGTPTALDEECLSKLMNMIHELFPVEESEEFTVESGRPDSITKEKFRILKEAGVTRISINPQTMHQETLDLIGRAHTVEQTKEAFLLARKCGFDNINMDIITGLPGESLSYVHETLDEIFKLRPESLTVHSLAIKRAAHLNIEMEKYQGMVKGSTNEMLRLVDEYASNMGMEAYYMYRQKNIPGNLEDIGYCVPDKECLYNILIMEEKQDIISCGAGASSKYVFEQGRIERTENVKNLDHYINRIDEMIDRKRKYL